MTCLNINSSEYRTRLAQSGLSEGLFKAFCTDFISRYDRYPNLDELPFADSSKFIKEQLHLNAHDASSVNDILETTGTESIEEAVVKLNAEYTDKETSIIPLNERAIVKSIQRPSRYSTSLSEDYTQVEEVNAAAFLSAQLDRLASLYGINFIQVTNDQVAEMGLPTQASAFIKDGNIYINTDNAGLDAPLHEMMHIFLGSMRYTNPTLYQEVVSSMQNISYFEDYSQQFPNRTRMDILEEIFVEQAGRLLAGLDSNLRDLSNKALYEIQYNIQRVLDSVLMGDVSVASLDGNISQFSLKELANMVQSHTMQNTFSGRIDLAAGEAHRILANVKSELLKSGDLIEQCS